jgi:hypothetical protein
MRVVDANGDGFVDTGDLAAFAQRLGTGCGVTYPPGQAGYSPVFDYVEDCFIDSSDLGLFAQHFGHYCAQWQPLMPPKSTAADELPWEVFELPEMQEAMRLAGVDRQWIVDFWFRNGPENRLATQGSNYEPSAHLAAVQKEQPALIRSSPWGNVKGLFR